MIIVPKVGIDSIKLGMSRDEVSSQWGSPDSIHDFIALEDSPEDKWIVWKYDKGIELNFDSEEEFLLISIDTGSAGVTFENVVLIGMSEKELRLKFPNIQYDDEFELDSGRNYILPEHELSFWLVDGKVTNITISPEFDKSNSYPLWPRKSI